MKHTRLGAALSPLRNQTTLQQERRAYDVFLLLVQGKDLPDEHLLRKLKLNTDEDNGKAWRPLPRLIHEFGLWEHTVKQIYCSFLRARGMGARTGIQVLAITDDTLCGLIARYANDEETRALFGLASQWRSCAIYKHYWCAK